LLPSHMATQAWTMPPVAKNEKAHGSLFYLIAMHP